MARDGGVFYPRQKGTWVTQLSFGRRGRRRYRAPTARTKAEAGRELAQMKADERSGLEQSKLSLGAYRGVAATWDALFGRLRPTPYDAVLRSAADPVTLDEGLLRP